MTYTFCGVTADIRIWRELGIHPYQNGRAWNGMENESGEATSHSTSGFAVEPGRIIEARATTGFNDERALAWLLGVRRKEEAERTEQATRKHEADARVHAARIQRQAALIQAKANGVTIDDSDY